MYDSRITCPSLDIVHQFWWFCRKPKKSWTFLTSYFSLGCSVLKRFLGVPFCKASFANHSQRIVPHFWGYSCVIFKPHKGQYGSNLSQCCTTFKPRLETRCVRTSKSTHWGIKRQISNTVKRRWLHSPAATTAKTWDPLCFSRDHRTAASFSSDYLRWPETRRRFKGLKGLRWDIQTNCISKSIWSHTGSC